MSIYQKETHLVCALKSKISSFKASAHFYVSLRGTIAWNVHNIKSPGSIKCCQFIDNFLHFVVCSCRTRIFFFDLLVLWGKWSKFSLVLTPVELVLKSGILKEKKTHNSVTYLQLVLGDM